MTEVVTYHPQSRETVVVTNPNRAVYEERYGRVSGATEAVAEVAPEPSVEEAVEETVADDRPAANASTATWMEYRLANGYSEEELAELGRNELRDLEDR